jgi:putative oxidoreductase
VADLFARFYVGLDFFRSGLVKLDDWEDTLDLFADDWALPFIPPVPAAWLATAGELILPMLLFLGLFTRVGALGLFVMAVVIELFVFPDTPQHYYWMVILGLIACYGPSKLSLDQLWLKQR